MAHPFRKYVEIQKHKMEVDKWCEGEKIRRDPGRDYLFSWIRQNAERFRIAYYKSKCKSCVKWKDCGYKVLQECNEFEESK